LHEFLVQIGECQKEIEINSMEIIVIRKGFAIKWVEVYKTSYRKTHKGLF